LRWKIDASSKNPERMLNKRMNCKTSILIVSCV
jgi:hypothetical protein